MDDTKPHALMLREKEIKQQIFRKNKYIWDYRKLDIYREEDREKCSVVITLRKEWSLPIESRIETFYYTLSVALIEGERLICENRCFTVEGPEYAITYCLEAYKKHASMMGYYEDGQPCIGLMYRMGTWETIKWMRTLSEQDRERIWTEMCRKVMLDKYKNPGDRFIACVNNEKQLRRDLRLVCKKRI